MKNADEHKIPHFLFMLKPTVICGFIKAFKSCDFCLNGGKIEALKMLDLQKKSAIDSTEPLVLL
jgi:hypothetical protein